MSDDGSDDEFGEDNQISGNLRNGEYSFMAPINQSSGKTLRSPVWKMWNWILDGDGNRIYGKIACVNCNTVRDYARSTEGTSNLKQHEDKCVKILKRKSISSLSNNEIQTIKSEVKNKVVQFVAQDIRAFRTTSCPGFQALADTLIAIGHNYGPLKSANILPHRTTIPVAVEEKAEEYSERLSTKLKEIQSQGLAATLDLWTEDHTKCHYIGMNVQYIEEGVVNEHTLCVKELDELSANGENIHIEIINMLLIYGIDIDNTVFVTDRGGEIRCALRDVAVHLNCGAHILKNIVDEMLKRISLDNNVRDLLKNCRSLVTYIKRSNIQYRLPHGLKSEVESRWNATLTMMKSIKKAQTSNDLHDYLTLKRRTYLLTDIDFDLLDEVEKLLDKFSEATLFFEAKSRPTIHYVPLYRRKLEQHLSVNLDDVPDIAEMKRFGLLYLRDNWILDDIHKKSVFFHPKIKHLQMFGAEEKSRLLAEIRRELQMSHNEDDDTNVSRPKRRKLNDSEVLERDDIIDEFCNLDEEVPMDEVQKYLESPIVIPKTGHFDLCRWWYEKRKIYPNLYKMSLKYLCIPASSATAETKFSLAGFLVNEKKTCLNPNVVNNMLRLKSFYDNSDLLV